MLLQLTYTYIGLYKEKVSIPQAVGVVATTKLLHNILTVLCVSIPQAVGVVATN